MCVGTPGAIHRTRAGYTSFINPAVNAGVNDIRIPARRLLFTYETLDQIDTQSGARHPGRLALGL